MTSERRVLIVDDDREIRESLSYYFDSLGWLAKSARSGDEALGLVREDLPDVVITDIRMPGMSGQDLLERLKAITASLPVVMITAHGDVPAAIQAMKQGAADFIEKPYEPDAVVEAARRAVETAELRQQNAALKSRLCAATGLNGVLVGDSADMVQLRQEIAEIADTDASVLIIGETGTGKELVANALHDMSPRSGGPLIAVNCASMPDDLFDAAMFGHKAGAFTGATTASAGFFRSADGGTLFLDELSACSTTAQPKLLRALENRTVTPLGENTAYPVDFRLITATNEDLESRIESGAFRTDLYYRVNTLVIRIPPLRQRSEDIVPLFMHHLVRFCSQYDAETPDLTAADMTALLQHRWPGNVRELRHVAERRAIAARRGRGSVAEAISLQGADGSGEQQGLKAQVEAFERQVINRALEESAGGMDDVADMLGIARRTLNEKMVRYGLKRE